MDKRLENLLAEKRQAVLDKWFDLVLESYPSDTAKFLSSQKDRFANPVGATIADGIANLFDEFLRGSEPERVTPFLDDILRIRAVQDFSPSQSVSFLFSLKGVLRDELKTETPGVTQAHLEELDARIDRLVLLAFDVFMGCRETLYDIKAKEVRRMTFRLLQQAKLVGVVPEEETEVKATDILTIKRKEVSP